MHCITYAQQQKQRPATATATAAAPASASSSSASASLSTAGAIAVASVEHDRAIDPALTAALEQPRERVQARRCYMEWMVLAFTYTVQPNINRC
jgi:hypothetical protein